MEARVILGVREASQEGQDLKLVHKFYSNIVKRRICSTVFVSLWFTSTNEEKVSKLNHWSNLVFLQIFLTKIA